MHKVADMPLASEAESTGRLGNLVLARIVGAPRGVDKGEIAADLALFAGPQMSASRWRAGVDQAIAALAAEGLVAPKPGGFSATAAGVAATARFLGVSVNAPLAWEQVCNVWLIGKALGQKRPPAKRVAALATLDGLRAAILVQAFSLSIKGAATSTRLRQALAAAALKRAFGGQSAATLAGKLGLSARASRLLAAQLLDKPRDPGTDRRLVSVLAAQACGAAGADLPALRAAVLRRFYAIPVQARQPRSDPEAPSVRPAPAARTRVEPQPAAAPPVGVPADGVATAPLDLPRFASEVRRCAAGEAQGWSGDRKAYISRVWRSLCEKRPEWGLSEIEFKCMLTEAHRAGQLALANADLKDESNIKDVQDSAVIYRNAVFHFVRVDA